MAKHSFEFKKVVLEYLDGKGGTSYLSKIRDLDLIYSYANGLMQHNAFAMKDYVPRNQNTLRKKISAGEVISIMKFHIKT